MSVALQKTGVKDKLTSWTVKQPASQLTNGKFFEPIGVICLPAKCEASQLCDHHFSCGVDCAFYEVAASCGSSPIADRDVDVVPCTCGVSRHQLSAACQHALLVPGTGETQLAQLAAVLLGMAPATLGEGQQKEQPDSSADRQQGYVTEASRSHLQH